MLLSINLHPTLWTHKPSSEEVGRFIKKDISNYLRTITPEELMTAIMRGQAFTAGVLESSTADSWQQQQLIVADIDNGEHKRDSEGNRVFCPVEDPLTPAEALAIMSQYNMVPYFMYYTFSHNTEGRAHNVDKFRIVTILDKPVTDPEDMKSYNERFAYIFNKAKPGAADSGIHNLDRLLFGSWPDSVFFTSGSVTALESLDRLPGIPEPPKQTVTAPRDPGAHSGSFDLLECLDYISPDDREVWFKVGMALKYERYSFEDWDLWACQSNKHDFEDSVRVWRSFADSDQGRSRVINGGYIVKLAKQNGYIPPSQRPRPAPVFLDWDSPIL